MPTIQERREQLLAKQEAMKKRHAAQLARLDQTDKKQLNGRKILWGAFLMEKMELDPKIAAWALRGAGEYFIRKVDQERVMEDMDRLAQIAGLPNPFKQAATESAEA